MKLNKGYDFGSLFSHLMGGSLVSTQLGIHLKVPDCSLAVLLALHMTSQVVGMFGEKLEPKFGTLGGWMFSTSVLDEKFILDAGFLGLTAIPTKLCQQYVKDLTLCKKKTCEC